MTPGYFVDPASINGSAHLFIEIAGLLHKGRLHHDDGTLARVPQSHPEIGAAVDRFARFADDQYRDLVLLLTALATKLHETGKNYVTVDDGTKEALDEVLAKGQYLAPDAKNQLEKEDRRRVGNGVNWAW